MSRQRIALICSFGLSTSLLVQAMEKEANERGLDLDICAIGASELQEQADGCHAFLLAPQVRYMKSNVEGYGRPVAIIDGMAYALAKGEQVLNQALGLLADSAAGENA